jgi:hypothetical protein
MPLRPPAEIRKLTTRARKVAETARTVSPTGQAFAELVDELVTVIGEQRDAIAQLRRESFFSESPPKPKRRTTR